jgi:TetR/AcrR family transcriptional regulator, mexJK operon transcriptional repressor
MAMEESGNNVIQPQSSRGRERLARILEAATVLFLKDGYGSTSIDSILDVSGGSKATLYNYFPTKDDLFRAVIDDVLASATEPSLDTHADPRTSLIKFSVQRLEVLFSPRHHALLRLIIAERERFPDIAKMFYERAPLRSRGVLATYFTELERRQVLDAGSSDEAAEFLIGMMVHWWVMEGLLLGESPSREAIRERATRVVDRFLMAFGRPGARGDAVA